MLEVVFQVNAHPDWIPSTKETLANHFEELGAMHFLEVETKPSAFILTSYLFAPDGSVVKFNRLSKPYLNKFRDTQIISVKEYFPQQLGF